MALANTEEYIDGQFIGNLGEILISNEAGRSNKAPEPTKNISKIFSDFMTRVTMLEELVTLGEQLLAGFQQSLDLLRRPPIDQRSELVENIIKANETKRLKSYIAAGCINIYDGVEATTKLHARLLELHNHLNKARRVVIELECLLEGAARTVESDNKNSFSSLDDDLYGDVDQHSSPSEKENIASFHGLEPVVTDYAFIMAVTMNMVKQDFEMQERIVTSLDHNSTSEELQSYCLMWSLRPFINDEIIAQAWKLVS